MAIEREQFLEKLKDFIANKVLDGKDIGLDYETPLLEWGVINSFELVKVMDFVRDECGVAIPPGKVVASNFKDMNSLANLVIELEKEGA